MPITRYLLGGVLVSGLVLASFLIYVDNFLPYFQQTNGFYYTSRRRFSQNSTMTVSRLLISTQPPNAQIRSHHNRTESPHARKTTPHVGKTTPHAGKTTSNQRNDSSDIVATTRNGTIQIIINNNVTTISPESFKELVVMNRHNRSTTGDVKTTMSLTFKSIPRLEKLSNVTVKTEGNTTQMNPPITLDTELDGLTEKKLVNATTTNATTVLLNTTKHFDRPNPDLSGYVKVTDLKKTLEIHCNTCAIVSSSGQMLNTKAGEEIDQNECVIRMNDAPVKKFERDIGTKTTIRVLGHSASGNLKNKARMLLLGTGQPDYVIMWGPERSMKTNGKGYGFNTMKLMSKLYGKNSEFYILTQEQMDFSDKSFEVETGKNRLSSGSWLTTGWFTIQLARNICDDIHMYGMISDDYCKYPENAKKGIRYHYYNSLGGTECGYYTAMERQHKNAHRFVTEKSIYARWAKLNPQIHFHHPDWEPPEKSKHKITWRK